MPEGTKDMENTLYLFAVGTGQAVTVGVVDASNLQSAQLLQSCTKLLTGFLMDRRINTGPYLTRRRVAQIDNSLDRPAEICNIIHNDRQRHRNPPCFLSISILYHFVRSKTIPLPESRGIICYSRSFLARLRTIFSMSFSRSGGRL